MYELVYKNDVKFDYCEQHINGIPTPFEIITENEWRELRHRWANSHYSYEQIHLKDQLMKIFDNDAGYANAYIDYNDEYAVAEIIKNYGNEQIIKYVKIGCKHDWELISNDRISYTQKCKKCGSIRELPTGV